jgi:hypothetical protein
MIAEMVQLEIERLLKCFNQFEVKLTSLYADVPRQAFHGLRHVGFVRRKALEIALLTKADHETIWLAASVHDLNYLVGSRASLRRLQSSQTNTAVRFWHDAGLGTSDRASCH